MTQDNPSDKYYGKYQAQVTDNKDPEKRGRLKLECASFPQIEELWALPCLPFAGKSVGWFSVPPKCAWVWLEFAAGDVEQPIWSGCFWEDAKDSPMAEYEHKSGQLAIGPEGKKAEQIKLFKTKSFSLSILDSDKTDKSAGSIKLSLNAPNSNKTMSFEINEQHLQFLTLLEGEETEKALGFEIDFEESSAAPAIKLHKGDQQHLIMNKKGIEIISGDAKDEAKQVKLSLSNEQAQLIFKKDNALTIDKEVVLNAKNSNKLSLTNSETKIKTKNTTLEIGSEVKISGAPVDLNNGKLKVNK